MPRFERLRQLVSGIGREHVYRTIYDEHYTPLIQGVEDLDFQGLEAFRKVDFQGKHVVDLGCNFGFFAFEAARRGAASVLAVDREANVLQGACLLRDAFGQNTVNFLACDIESPGNCLQGRTFDMAMLVEFMGKTFVRAGLVERTLAFYERLSDKELVLSVQKSYYVRKELGSDMETMRRFYPEAYLHGGAMHLLEYVRDFFKDRWNIQMLSDLAPGYEKPRKFMRLYR
ncbi:tRNA (mo5U34)-methyltransferase [Fundidesulfovibrio magnetotacticus]|uniref:tRNA (Mo5U34)-methyltransferase n=1 Tax=Fundidesulfovibrio magnetotacticus TaxID=2730080 RepID=A0A6V8LPK9_9BACT|nr:class I SAM-dependent methyltransferase [Fundidesulfovibrio magnetotacticus]GFK94503.1 tRNA (mo5U34)-methyltransferase [Fundidesulfovibrio magnetotacticus]